MLEGMRDLSLAQALMGLFKEACANGIRNCDELQFSAACNVQLTRDAAVERVDHLLLRFSWNG